MADLSDVNAAQAVKIVGSDSSGAESTPIRAYANGEFATADLLNVGGVQGALSVTTTAIEAKVGVAKLTNRKILTVAPTTGVIYWGYTNAVTVSTGTPIFKNQICSFDIADSSTIFLISSGTVNVRVTEGS